MRVKLGDILTINPRESIPRGTVARKIAMENLRPFQRDVFECSYEKYKGGTKFRNRDTILARITPCLENGKTAFINCLNENELAFGSTEYYVLRPKEEILDPYYLFYLVTSKKFRSVAIKGMAGTSGRQRVPKEIVKSYELDLPSIEEQRRISSILRILDDKQTINNRVNDNLLELAQTIFKEILRITPLHTLTISDVGTVVGGGTPSKKVPDYWNGNIPWLSPKDLSNHPRVFTSHGENCITQDGLDNSSTKLLPQNTVLFSSRAPIGYLSIASNQIATNQGFESVVSNKDYPFWFVYELLKSETPKIISEASGSTFKEISGGRLKQHEVSVPMSTDVMKYNSVFLPLFDKIRQSEEEIDELSQIKSALLNKLF